MVALDAVSKPSRPETTAADATSALHADAYSSLPSYLAHKVDELRDAWHKTSYGELALNAAVLAGGLLLTHKLLGPGAALRTETEEFSTLAARRKALWHEELFGAKESAVSTFTLPEKFSGAQFAPNPQVLKQVRESTNAIERMFESPWRRHEDLVNGIVKPIDAPGIIDKMLGSGKWDLFEQRAHKAVYSNAAETKMLKIGNAHELFDQVAALKRMEAMGFRTPRGLTLFIDGNRGALMQERLQFTGAEKLYQTEHFDLVAQGNGMMKGALRTLSDQHFETDSSWANWGVNSVTPRKLSGTTLRPQDIVSFDPVR